MNRQVRQKGQVMPLGIALVMFSTLMVIVVYNTGQVASDKTRLANAADAAVYSGLVWQSRALNFQSYTNRAMVANQVTMAQAVSLKSWSLYGRIASENLNTLLGSVPYLGALTNVMATAMSTVGNTVDPVSTALLSLVNTVNGVLGKAQSAMYTATFVATPDIVRKVAFGNDPGFSVDSAFSVFQSGRNLQEWRSFTNSYTSDHELGMTTRAGLINRSRDAFTSGRDWEFFNRWFYIAPAVRFKLHKRGETRLINSGSSNASGSNQWEWKAKDTLSFNTKIWRPIKKDKKVELPIGWGQAYANQSTGERSIEASCNGSSIVAVGQLQSQCERWFDYNRSAEYRADNNVKSLAGRDSREQLVAEYNGIRAYRDLANLGKQEKDPRLGLRVEIQSPLKNTATANRQGIGGVFGAEGKAASRSLASIASGEVYFKKPLQPGAGDHIEYANGYNPFWDVRLTNTPDSTRAQAWLLLDASLLASTTAAGFSAPGSVSTGLDSYVEPQTNSVVSNSGQASGEELELILANAVSDTAIPQSSDIDNQVADSAQVAATAASIGTAADAQTQAVDQEFSSIRAEVVHKYLQGLAAMKADSATVTNDLQAQADVIRLRLDTNAGGLNSVPLTQAQRKELQARLLELHLQLEQNAEQSREAQAQLLVDAVNSSTDKYRMDLATALQVVDLDGDVGENLADALRISCSDSDALDSDDLIYQQDKDCDAR